MNVWPSADRPKAGAASGNLSETKVARGWQGSHCHSARQTAAPTATAGNPGNRSRRRGNQRRMFAPWISLLGSLGVLDARERFEVGCLRHFCAIADLAQPAPKTFAAHAL